MDFGRNSIIFVLMEDLPKHQGQRRQLADLLEKKGIEDPQILKAIASVPRHFFMDKGKKDGRGRRGLFLLASFSSLAGRGRPIAVGL